MVSGCRLSRGEFHKLLWDRCFRHFQVSLSEVLEQRQKNILIGVLTLWRDAAISDHVPAGQFRCASVATNQRPTRDRLKDSKFT